MGLHLGQGDQLLVDEVDLRCRDARNIGIDGPELEHFLDVVDHTIGLSNPEAIRDERRSGRP